MYKENTLMNRTLTRRIAFSEQFDFFTGTDLGKEKNEAIIVDSRLKQHGRFRFTHNRESYEKLYAWLKRYMGDGRRVLVGLEPTNDYWEWLVAFLEAHDIPYRLVNAFTVKKSREGAQLDYAKDDRRDALTIARLLREGQFTETQRQSALYAQLRQYEQAHWRLSSEIGRQKTILRQYAERLFPELRQVFRDLTGMTALTLLKNHAEPQRIAALSWDDFEAGVRGDLTGSRLMVKKLRQVHALAADSIGLQPGAALQLLIQQQIAALELKQRQLVELEKQLLACFHELPHAPYLLSVGIGDLTAARIAAQLGDLSRFSAAKQLVKLAGIQPTPNQSGQRERDKTPMSGKGRAHLRTYLFFAVMRLVRWDEAFAAKQEALVNCPKRPRKRIEAIGILMNKLLHLIWAVCHKQTPYSAELFAQK
jgi:transposase